MQERLQDGLRNRTIPPKEMPSLPAFHIRTLALVNRGLARTTPSGRSRCAEEVYQTPHHTTTTPPGLQDCRTACDTSADQLPPPLTNNPQPTPPAANLLRSLPSVAPSSTRRPSSILQLRERGNAASRHDPIPSRHIAGLELSAPYTSSWTCGLVDPLACHGPSLITGLHHGFVDPSRLVR